MERNMKLSWRSIRNETYTFDLDRDMCDIDEIEFNQNYDLEYYIYLGA